MTTSTTSPVVTGFEPMGSSFIDAENGWVLGATGCQSCAGLEESTNGGTSWNALSAPPFPLGSYSTASDAVSDVYFANQEDGFLYGPSLEVTLDGGHTWSHADVPSASQVIGEDGYAFDLSQSEEATLWRTSIGSNTWSPVALPASTGAFQIAAQGGTIVLLRSGTQSGPTGPGALWKSTDAGLEWVSRTVPCLTTDGGAALMSIALGHPDAWLLDCFNNEQSSQAQNTQHHLYGTSDAGQHWVRLGDPPQTGDPELLADNGSGHAFLATQGGDQLDGTFDGGLQWSRLFASGGVFFGWADLQFVDASTGFVVGPTHYAPEHLYRTEDGGRTWTILEIPSSA
ncbi:MAG TPA: hypothetical protein VGH31_05450 [Acidimicrobiales bacterium]